MIRVGHPQKALNSFATLDRASLSHREMCELLTLELSASILTGATDEAEVAMQDAMVRACGVGSAELQGELLYYRAAFEWSLGRYAETKAVIATLLDPVSTIPAWLREDVPLYPFNRTYWRARGYELLAMTAAIEKNYRSQTSFLVKAFEEYDRAECEDVRIEASMLANLAVLLRDLQDPAVVRFVRDRFERIAWNEGLAEFRFAAQRALGWCSALSGDHLGGLREFRQSVEFAPSVPARIAAILDRAFIAGELNERYFAQEQLDYACQLALGVDWEAADHDEREVLLDLAKALAFQDVAKSRRLLDTYTGLRMPNARLDLFAQDCRGRGVECMAIAAVVRAENQLGRATMLYKEAFDIWSQIGYRWRAACAALELYTLTGDAAYLAIVAREAAERPQSWIAKRYAAVALEDPASFVRA